MQKCDAVQQACGDRMLPEQVVRQVQQRARHGSGAMSSRPSPRWTQCQGTNGTCKMLCSMSVMTGVKADATGSMSIGVMLIGEAFGTRSVRSGCTRNSALQLPQMVMCNKASSPLANFHQPGGQSTRGTVRRCQTAAPPSCTAMQLLLCELPA